MDAECEMLMCESWCSLCGHFYLYAHNFHDQLSLFFVFCPHLSTPHHLSPFCCLHFSLSSPAVDRVGVRPLWPVEQVTALTWPWFHSCAFCHLPVSPSHFNNVDMGQAQTTENILCPGAHSPEPRCTPEPHMHTPTLSTTLWNKGTGSACFINTKIHINNSELFSSMGFTKG